MLEASVMSTPCLPIAGVTAGRDFVRALDGPASRQGNGRINERGHYDPAWKTRSLNALVFVP